jgi:hypothetical protein
MNVTAFDPTGKQRFHLGFDRSGGDRVAMPATEAVEGESVLTPKA